jgi:hypothetical protein
MTDDQVFGRIRALLAKAEATEFEAEADAFFAKAHDLMVRHAIDEADLQADTDPDGFSLHRFDIPGPYARAKVRVATVVARSLGCQLVFDSHRGPTGVEYVAEVIGTAVDHRYVEALFTSVLIHGDRDLLREPRRDRSFRNNFWHAFAARLDERLRTQREVTEHDLDATVRPGAALVLADKSVRTAKWVREHMSTRRAQPSRARFDAEGRAAGVRSANGVELHRRVTSST